jgi:hypothetical protein
MEESDIVLGLISNITNLKNINTTDQNAIPDLVRCYVEGVGEYVFKRNDTVAESSPNIIKPNTGTGRWSLVSPHSVNNQLRLILKATADISTLNTSLTNHTHTAATASVAGFMSTADKTKLDTVESYANNYTHPTTDGSLHVPATSTTNNLKVLKAGANAGSIAWGNVSYTELTNVPTSFAPSAHTHTIADVTNLQTTLNAKEDTANKGVANGYASLDANAKVPVSQLPDSIVGQVEYQGTYDANTNTPALPAASTVKGHYYVVSAAGTQESTSFENGDWVISNGATWEKVDNSDAVTTVHGRNGNVVAYDGDYTASQITNTPAGSITATTVQAALNDLDTSKSSTSHTHSNATTGVAGFMSNTDKSKLDGIAASANNYSHPSGDGNMHVPATSTINNNKVLKAGATAGVFAWGSVAYSELTGTPSTFAPSAHTHTMSDVTGLQGALDAKANTSHTHLWADITDKPSTYAPSAHTHAISDITNLTTTLGNKSDISHIHSNATGTVAGFMSNADKTKLDGVAENANNYVHPTGDGNMHVPINGTTNNNKILKSGATAGTIAWSTIAYSELTGVPSTFTPSAHTHLWADITDKPSTFAPSAHTHTIADVTGLQTALNAKSDTSHSHSNATTGAAGFMSNTDKSKLDGIATNANNYSHPTGDGNLHVPVTGTTNNLKVLKAGATAGVFAWGSVAYSELTGTPSTFVPSAHTHTISDVTGLQGALDAKANTSHTHLWADITDKPSTFTPSAHTHAISDVTGLQTALNGKANTSHTHLWADITDKPSTFAPSAHTHAISDVTGLQTALDAKEGTANKGVANGYASLDANAKVPTTQLPDSILGQVFYKGTYDANTNTPTLSTTPASSTKGNYYVVSVAGTFNSVEYQVGDWIISNGTTWDKVDNTDSVSTVFGRTGAIVASAGDYTASQITNTPAGSITGTTVQAALNDLDTSKSSTSHTHSNATTGVAGFMSNTDKTKLDGISANANNYSHPTGDGNLHVPATGTTNNLKVLKAGSSAGSFSWANIAYTELTGVPSSFTPSAHTHAIADVTNLQTSLDGKAASSHTHLWADITDKPSTFTPSAHTHAISDVTGLQTALDGKEASFTVLSIAKGGTGVSTTPSNGQLLIGNGTGYTRAALTAGTNISITNASGSITINSTYTYTHPTGDGNLHVPVTGTTNNLKVLKAGATAGVFAWGNVAYSELTGVPSTFAPSAHTHEIADITGLQTTLTGKANTSHTHLWADITDKPSTFTPSAHTHEISDVTGLQTALDGKEASFTVLSIAKGGTGVSTTPSNGQLLIGNGTGYTRAALTAGTNISITNASGSITINSTYTYTHPTGDGNMHVPVTGTTNNLKVLKAGATAGVFAWGNVAYSELTGVPSTFAPSAHTHAWGDITDKPSTFEPSAHTHSNATTGVAGFMSSADKTKLDGIATNATNYSHPTGDGNLHVPVTGTTNNLKVLKAGATAGVFAWGNVAYSELTGTPSTFTPSAHTHSIADVTNIYITNTTFKGYLEDVDNWTGADYTGLTVTAFKGQKHYDGVYFYECVDQNTWIRMQRI